MVGSDLIPLSIIKVFIDLAYLCARTKVTTHKTCRLKQVWSKTHQNSQKGQTQTCI